jgi:monoamine oxidase
MISTAKQEEYLSLVNNGFPQNGHRPKRVVIVGAGMAGLVAGYELLKAGHDPIILEARHRVGGRVYTVRDPFADGLHGEAGAMRLPLGHKLTMAYVEKFNLETFPFTMGNPKAYVHLQGKKVRAADFDPNQYDFDLAPHEKGQKPQALMEESLRPLKELLAQKGEAAWEEIVAKYDEFSTREFLVQAGWSEGAIELFGILSNNEARMNYSFVEYFRSEMEHGFSHMVQIKGGTDQLPRALAKAMPTLSIRYGAKLTALEQSPTSATVHYQTRAGTFKETGDHVILTVPFPVLRHVEVMPAFSHRKQRAIRQLNYDASGKIFFQCRRRFWEEDDGIFGGGTLTDRPVRNIYYPEHGRETGRGVLIASYTWAQDAERWQSLSMDDRITQALENVAEVHPQVLQEFEVGFSQMWHDDEFAGGAFALFEPEQQTLLHEAIIQPEGRIHFAGEHAALSHRWIQGAVESGIRTALEIHAAVD